MNTKTKLLLFVFLLGLVSLLVVDYANAQTCNDPSTPGSETGQCRSGCGSDEHEITGTCLGQVCCAGGGEEDEDDEDIDDEDDYDDGYYDDDEYYDDDSDETNADSGGGGWNPGNYAMFGLPSGRIYDIIYNFLFWILALFGAFGLIGFVISGIMYLTSAGDDTQIEKAKKAMKWSLVGVIVGLAGLVVMLAVDELLSGWSTRF